MLSHSSHSFPVVPRVLSIAGTDPTGGAGAQADIKAISAAGGFALSVITAVIAQNTQGVRCVHTPPLEMLRAQLDAVFEDVTVDAVKIGMLGDVETIAVVADYLHRYAPSLVILDPVMVATSGDRLLQEDAITALRSLCSQADVITPNLPELGILADRPQATTMEAGIEQAKRLAEKLGTIVIVKGGHLTADRADNAVVTPDKTVTSVAAPRIDTTSTHGTGCSLSSALATRLAYGDSPAEALRWSTQWLLEAISAGADLEIGRGHGPVDHGHRQRRLEAAACTTPWPEPLTVPEVLKNPEDLASPDVWHGASDLRVPHIAAAGPWTAALWRAAAPIRTDIQKLAFIEQLGNGTLPDREFTFYLQQDARYLNEYSRALALLGATASSPDDRVEWARDSRACIEEEAALHRSYLANRGQAEASSPVTAAYTDFLVASTAAEDYVVGAAAVLPCYWLYAEVGLELQGLIHPSHPYRDWLLTYSDEGFAQNVAESLARVERAFLRAGAEDRARAARAFLIACVHEREFFDQAMRQR